MKTKNIYCCEKCNLEFQHEFQCKQHERECGVLHTHVCDKCGKVTKYSKDDNHPDWYLQNECWTLTPNHHRAGYGSKMDGSEFVLELCDDCLYEFVHNCNNVEGLLNSGSNTYYDCPDYEDDQDEDWELNDPSETE